MKKLLLGLGALASVAAPVAAVVACGATPAKGIAFKEASDAEKAKLSDLSTAVAGLVVGNADGTGEVTKTEIQGDFVRFTVEPKTITTADEAYDAGDVISSRFTVDLSNKKVTNVEESINGGEFKTIKDKDGETTIADQLVTVTEKQSFIDAATTAQTAFNAVPTKEAGTKEVLEIDGDKVDVDKAPTTVDPSGADGGAATTIPDAKSSEEIARDKALEAFGDAVLHIHAFWDETVAQVTNIEVADDDTLKAGDPDGELRHYINVTMEWAEGGNDHIAVLEWKGSFRSIEKLSIGLKGKPLNDVIALRAWSSLEKMPAASSLRPTYNAFETAEAAYQATLTV